MARISDNFSTFLETIKQQQPSSQAQQQNIAPSPSGGGTAQRILDVMANYPNGVPIEILYKETGLDFNQFATAMELLKKISAISVVKNASGEIAFRGTNADDVASILS